MEHLRPSAAAGAPDARARCVQSSVPNSRQARDEPENRAPVERIRPHVQRFNGAITDRDRAALLGHMPVTVWLTGLSGAGKSTIAFHLERELMSMGHACYVLDGDNIRHGLTSDLGFSKEDRRENIRRVAHVARLMNDAGLIVIAALISPMREDREMACAIIGNDSFVETYVAASANDCAKRDPKGLYAKAQAGIIESFTGVTAPYEPPENPELLVDTATLTEAASVSCVLEYLRERFLVLRR